MLGSNVASSRNPPYIDPHPNNLEVEAGGGTFYNQAGSTMQGLKAKSYKVSGQSFELGE